MLDQRLFSFAKATFAFVIPCTFGGRSHGEHLLPDLCPVLQLREHPRSCGGARLGSLFRNSLLCCANHTLRAFYILFLGAKYKES